jgi:hypothetical protein
VHFSNGMLRANRVARNPDIAARVVAKVHQVGGNVPTSDGAPSHQSCCFLTLYDIPSGTLRGVRRLPNTPDRQCKSADPQSWQASELRRRGFA